MTDYKAPRPPKGEHEVTLYPDWANDEPVVCHFEFNPGEKATAMEPGYPEEINLTCAYIRGWDCYRILDDKMIAELEESIAIQPRGEEYEP